MASTIKVDNVQNTPGTNIINKCGTTITVGAACNSVAVTGNVVKSNAVQASDGGNIVNQCGTTITLGASGDTVTLASGASQTGFGREGSVDWDTASIKTATFSGVSGNGYFCNTSGGAFTCNLPAGSAGAIIAISDYGRTFASYNLTVSPNGAEKMGGVPNDVILNVNGQAATFVYVDSTKGWVNVQETQTSQSGTYEFICASVSGACNTLTTAPDCSDVKLATFVSPGTFTVNGISSSTPARNTVGYMVVAGGGGGSYSNGGGGGAGGFREGRNVPIDNFTASPLVANAPTNAITVTATAYPITVGAGGTEGPPGETPGGVSTFSSICSAGGGKGTCAGNGGSGGGGKNGQNGGSGNTPPTSPVQGTDGGNAPGSGGPGYSSAGGGGAGCSGGPATPGSVGGVGGNGVSSSITGASVARAGGGGGTRDPGDIGGNGGTGGGGAGGRAPNNPGTGCGVDGTTNLGGGGGGATSHCSGTAGGKGGSGVVYIRYKFQ